MSPALAGGFSTTVPPGNFLYLKKSFRGFPGGAVIENPPANAGDMGLIPGPGRSHTLQSNWACEPRLLSLRSRAHEPQLLSPQATTTEACVPRVCALQQEKIGRAHV